MINLIIHWFCILKENTYVLSEYINDGLYLDDIPFGDYYLFVSSEYTLEDGSVGYKYYSINNATTYDMTTYYSMSKYEKKVTIDFEDSYPTMMLHVEKNKDDSVYDIVIDPGHGGSDPGAIGASGLKEKQITLEIGMRLKELLEKEGAKVYMTRTTDKDVYSANASDRAELQARVNVAEKNNSDLFISLHINSSVKKNVGGFSSYYYPKTDYDLKIAQAIQNKFAKKFGVDNLGVRQANFYVVKRCSMPATLLEMCFISNPKEEKLMKGKWFQKKTARLIVEGVKDYFD